jgi:uncharacterized membrane protein
MESFYNVLRVLHVIAGASALLSGPVAMLNQNGKKLHRISGKIYFYAMLFIFVSAIVLAIHTGNMFLLMIGIFSVILVATGYRALYLKKLNRGQKPALIDWTILAAGLICGISLFIWGFTKTFLLHDNFGITGLAFGFILLRGAKSDYVRFTKPSPDKNDWLYKHIGGMIGGYIATFTAFLVQNINGGFIVWLLPTFLFVPFIFYTIRKFKLKTAKNETLSLEVRK